LKPAFVTGDNWDSCIDNLKRVRNHQLGWQFALESNRQVSVKKDHWVAVRDLAIPDEGRLV